MLLMNGTNITKSFAGETLFENVSFNVYDKDKIGFVGINGAGKSTLFKIIIGMMDFDSGNLSKSRDVKIGYLEQYPVSDGTHYKSKIKSVLRGLGFPEDVYPNFKQTEIRNALALFLFQGDDVFKDINSLSGGEMARVDMIMMEQCLWFLTTDILLTS